MTQERGRSARYFIGRLARPWLVGILMVLVGPGSASQPALAQDAASAPVDANATIKAGLYISPPFVMRTANGYSGMAVELWEALAEQRGLDTQYVEYRTLPDLVGAVRAGDVSVAVTNLTITQARAKLIDFTHPWFDAGLQIMISEAPRTGFSNVLGGLADAGHLRVFAWIAGIILVATVLLTLFDRRFDPHFATRWRDGIAESFYAVMSVAVSGKLPPSRPNLFGWVGRIWAALWLVCGVAVLAYVTSSVTTVMTTLALADRINGLSDLPGKDIGVVTGSTAEEFAATNGLSATPYENIDLAVGALVEGEIAAIVGDAPVLDYYAFTRPEHDVSVVGEIFEPDKYGFGLMLNSTLRRPLNVHLLGADEDGLIEDLRTRSFGERS